MAPKRIRTVEGSCLKCKERRIKCDLKNPCTKCVSGNYECNYDKPFRFQIVAAESIAKKGKVPKRRSSLALDCMMVTCVRTIESEHQYFDTVLAPKLTMYGKSLQINDMLKDPLLDFFVQVVSSAHQLLSQRDETSIEVAQTARTMAIDRFKNQILDPSSRNSSVLFTGSVFLCLLDGVIYPKSNDVAIMHLKGGRLILRQLGDCEAQLRHLRDPISMMMLSYFGTMDLNYCILTGSKPHFDASFWLAFGSQRLWWGTLDVLDPFLAIFSSLAMTSHLVSEDLISISQFAEIQNFFKARCEYDPGDPWSCFCLVFSMTGLIYTYRAICGHGKDNLLVQEVVGEAISVVDRLQNHKLHHCLLFPLLVVGAHSVVPEQQAIVMRSVVDSYTYLRFGSVRALQLFLQATWELSFMHLNWNEQFSTIANKAFPF